MKVKYAVCALITRNNKSELEVLAVSRKNDRTAFGLPGGKVDQGETIEKALVRELWEETGLTAKTFKPVFERQSEGETDYHTYTYVITSYEGHVIQRPNEGTTEWVSIQTLLDGPFGRYNRELFRKLDLI